MPSSYPQSPFSPLEPNQASSVLFLIENSEAMAGIWYDMFTSCLTPLLSEFEGANHDAPTKVIVMENLPLPGSSLPGPSAASGGIHSSLCALQFNGSPNNRLSTSRVNAAIDLLSNVTYSGEHVISHLVIVAASAPIDDPLMGIRQYAWFLLAEKLQKANILCHLVLARTGEDMSSLIGLYDKTKWLQGASEAYPANQVACQSRYVFKFSRRPSNIFLPKKYPGFPLAIPSSDANEESTAVSEQKPWKAPSLQQEYQPTDVDLYQALRPGASDPVFALPPFSNPVASYSSYPYQVPNMKLEEDF